MGRGQTDARCDHVTRDRGQRHQGAYHGRDGIRNSVETSGWECEQMLTGIDPLYDNRLKAALGINSAGGYQNRNHVSGIYLFQNLRRNRGMAVGQGKRIKGII